MKGMTIYPSADSKSMVDLKLNEDNGLIFGTFKSRVPGGLDVKELWIQFSKDECIMLSHMFERMAHAK